MNLTLKKTKIVSTWCSGMKSRNLQMPRKPKTGKKPMFLQSNQKNFDKFAEDVVTDFLTQATPLSDAIVKLADTNMLKPEEVKRVVEKANTLATIRLIKTAQNGDLTFDLADPDKVLGRTH